MFQNKMVNSSNGPAAKLLTRSAFVWSNLIKFDQFWSSLIEFDQVWLLIRFDEVWSSLIWLDQDWSSMIKYDQDWSSLIKLDWVPQVEPINRFYIVILLNWWQYLTTAEKHYEERRLIDLRLASPQVKKIVNIYIYSYCPGQFPRGKRDVELDRVHCRSKPVQRGISGRLRLPADLLRARAESLWRVRMQQPGINS